VGRSELWSRKRDFEILRMRIGAAGCERKLGKVLRMVSESLINRQTPSGAAA
jgi:hypothetical protein